jgi:hypothetical protein
MKDAQTSCIKNTIEQSKVSREGRVPHFPSAPQHFPTGQEIPALVVSFHVCQPHSGVGAISSGRSSASPLEAEMDATKRRIQDSFMVGKSYILIRGMYRPN